MPCKQLPNGEPCINGNECESNLCLKGACHEPRDFYVWYITIAAIALGLVVIIGLLCLGHWLRRQRRTSGAEFASSHYHDRAESQDRRELLASPKGDI